MEKLSNTIEIIHISIMHFAGKLARSLKFIIIISVHKVVSKLELLG